MGISITLASYLQEETALLLKQVESSQLKRSDLDRYCAECIENCSLLLANLERAANLISSFKLVAVDQSSDEIRTFKISEYIEEVLKSLHPHIKKTDINIEVNAPHDEPFIKTYPGAIAQIITNLVMNTLIHAFDIKKSNCKINLSLITENDDMLMTFCDNGTRSARQSV